MLPSLHGVFTPARGPSRGWGDLRQPYTHEADDLGEDGEAVHCTKYVQTEPWIWTNVSNSRWWVKSETWAGSCWRSENRPKRSSCKLLYLAPGLQIGVVLAGLFFDTVQTLTVDDLGFFVHPGQRARSPNIQAKQGKHHDSETIPCTFSRSFRSFLGFDGDEELVVRWVLAAEKAASTRRMTLSPRSLPRKYILFRFSSEIGSLLSDDESFTHGLKDPKVPG